MPCCARTKSYPYLLGVLLFFFVATQGRLPLYPQAARAAMYTCDQCCVWPMLRVICVVLMLCFSVTFYFFVSCDHYNTRGLVLLRKWRGRGSCPREHFFPVEATSIRPLVSVLLFICTGALLLRQPYTSKILK